MEALAFSTAAVKQQKCRRVKDGESRVSSFDTRKKRSPKKSGGGKAVTELVAPSTRVCGYGYHLWEYTKGHSSNQAWLHSIFQISTSFASNVSCGPLLEYESNHVAPPSQQS